jgi:hypothetical protein
VKSVVERAQALLRHAHKSEARDLSRITIRDAVQRLIGPPKGDMQLAVLQSGSGGSDQEVAQYMKVTLDGLSTSLGKLHNHWKGKAQEGDAATASMDLENIQRKIEQSLRESNEKFEQHFKNQDAFSKHIISIQAEQRKKQIPCVLLLIPDQQSGANIIDKVQNWMRSKVMDQLLLVMQCEMRVAEGRLPTCAHGVLWHRPEPSNPSDLPYGYKFSQPKESIRKLKNVLRHVTTVVKVCICRHLSPFVAELLLHDACPYVPRLTAFSRC